MFTEIASTAPTGTKPEYRLCLDRVENPDFPYALVWRGNKAGPDGFQKVPAHFSWKGLGMLIRRAIHDKQVRPEEVGELLTELLRPEPPEESSGLR